MPAYAYSAAESGADKHDPLPEGDYEVAVEKAELKTLQSSGKIKISLWLRIRSDVEQEGKGRVVFDDIWKEKEHPEFFNRKRLNAILGALDTKDGTVFDTIQDLLSAIRGGHLIAHVVQEFDQFHGETINRVKFYNKSKVKPQSLAPAASGTAGIELSDDELPF
jgi:hypothetical protein